MIYCSACLLCYVLFGYRSTRWQSFVFLLTGIPSSLHLLSLLHSFFHLMTYCGINFVRFHLLLLSGKALHQSFRFLPIDSSSSTHPLYCYCFFHFMVYRFTNMIYSLWFCSGTSIRPVFYVFQWLVVAVFLFPVHDLQRHQFALFGMAVQWEASIRTVFYVSSSH